MSGREYPPVVWRRVRNALRYEQGAQGIAAQHVGEEPSPEAATGEQPEQETQTTVLPRVPGTPPAKPIVKQRPPEASTVPGQIFPPDLDRSSSRQRFLVEDRSIVDAYHRQATSGDGGGYWCRVGGCMHRAAAHNGVCPVCADKGFKPVADETGDAA